MDKNEILKKSRRDNRNCDEWQKSIMLKGYRFATIVTAILLGILCIARQDIIFLIVIIIMSLCRDIYGAIRMRRKVDIVLVIFDVLFCAVWVYNYVKGVL